MKLTLNHGETQIEVGSGVSQKLISYLKKNRVKKVLLMSDQRLLKARASIKRILKLTQVESSEIALKAGENLKDFKSIYPLYGELLKKKLDRDSVIIALGGGSVGDAAGFVAATYLRGIDWIGIPTTLLSQVDSSIGGKTGINHGSGKNLIGAFHQPRLVICDIQFLGTLSSREIASGLGEMLKYAITYDEGFFSYFQKNLELLLKQDVKALETCIKRSLQFKINAVEKDEYDRTGVREVLNFGHTFGHALESYTTYQTYQHGEAVIWGMRFAVALSIERGHLTERAGLEILALLFRIPTPPLPENLNFKKIMEFMKKDKKSSNQKVRFVLLKKVGETVSDREITATDLEHALSRIHE